MNEKEIIEDAIAHYCDKEGYQFGNKPGSRQCYYWVESTGNSCAVGRHLSRQTIEDLNSTNDLSATLFETWEKIKDDLPVKKIEFWKRLQEIHDEAIDNMYGRYTHLGRRMDLEECKRIAKRKFTYMMTEDPLYYD